MSRYNSEYIGSIFLILYMKQPIAVSITDTHLSENTIEINISIFKQAFNICDELGVKSLLHLGDIFNSRKGQPEQVLNTWKSILDEAAERQIIIYAIPGNHDKTDLTSDASFLDAFDGHPAFKVLKAGQMFSNEFVDLYFLPYYDEKLVYVEKLKAIIENMAQGRISILCTHVGIEGSFTNKGAKKESEVTSNKFNEFTYVIIGHYHNRQVLEGGKIIYTGSGYQANFGEDRNKGVIVIYDTENKNEIFDFLQLDFPEYITVDVLPEDITKELVDSVKLKQLEANIRIRVQGEVSEEKKHLVVLLQDTGAKVLIEKESFEVQNISANKTLVMNDNDILTSFDEWSTSKEIENPEFGRQLLNDFI